MEKKLASEWNPEIIFSEEGYKAGVLQITWLGSMDTGWGNGYVMLPKGHPWITDDPFNLDVNVHGGITFGKEIDGEYWIGFDTAHYMDNSENRPKDWVIEETLELLQNAIIANTQKQKS